MATIENEYSSTLPVPDTVVPERFVGRWLSGGVAVLLAFLLCYSLATNPNIDYAAIREFLFNARILDGLAITLELAVISMPIGILIGLILALCRLSSNPVTGVISWVYIWVFRGTPLLVQVLFWGNFALFYKHITLGIPFTDIVLASWSSNAIITTFVASVLALSLHEAAYMAEIIRSGIQSVSVGQHDAALALGMTPRQVMRKVVLPQALRVIVPPTGNQFINLLKMTSLVAVIAGGDLLSKVLNISAVNLKTIELLIVASLWYLLVVSITSIGQAMLERRLGRGTKTASY